ncbi:MAG TPA: TetR/AcrR family transcriptional regulator [Ramlibacter sp.]|nr:TetR/AcrR family transcriptional regulator [Ramlibacter sp.]
MARAVHRIATPIKDTALIAERRNQIVEAATAVFLEKGYHAATTRDVVLRAGLAQGSLYNYVRTKPDILYLVADKAVEDYQNTIHEALEGVQGPEERLRVAIRAAVTSQYEHRDAIALVMREGHALEDTARRALRKRADQFFDLMCALVEEGLPRRRGRKASAKLLAETITYLPTMVAMRPWRLAGEGTQQQVVDALVETIEHAVGLREA